MRNILVFTLLLLIPLGASAQIVDIPDPNLRTVLNKRLQKAPNTPITQVELASLTSLQADDRGISELTGLEHAVNLERLSIRSNVLTDISLLGDLKNLVLLDLGWNHITDISAIALLKNLESLYLDTNQIRDISPLVDLPTLDTLHLRNNKIADISPLTLLNTLEQLDLEWNQISDISHLANLKNLVLLDLGWNQITDVSHLATLNTLALLLLDGNTISDISPLAGLHNLKWLYLQGNQITDISPLAGMDALERLYLQGNQITDTSPLADLPDRTEIAIGVQRPQRPADVNSDNRVNVRDLIIVAQQVDKTEVTVPLADVDSDGVVNILDLLLVARNFDAVPGAPTVAENTSALIRTLLVEARAADDGSLAFRDGIANLEKLLAALVPKETRLLANYPNPFNPETWIPYHLSTDTEVNVTIYAPTGEVVRKLALGHQTAGRYTDRTRAAYWDGRNDAGEQVASGIYFYELRTEKTSLLRKMVILK